MRDDTRERLVGNERDINALKARLTAAEQDNVRLWEFVQPIKSRLAWIAGAGATAGALASAILTIIIGGFA